MTKLAERYVAAVRDSTEPATPLQAALFAQACCALVALARAFVKPEDLDDSAPQASEPAVNNSPAEPERNSILYRARRGQVDDEFVQE